MSVKQELLLYQTDLGRLDLFLVRLVTLDLPKIIEDYDKEVVDSRGIELNLVNLHEQIKNVYYAYSTTHKRILDNIAETWFDWQRFGGLEEKKIETSKKPTKILLVGLFGSGKTTTAGKLAKHFQKRGLNVALLQTDTWRPAAYEQLKQLSEKIKARFFGEEKGKDAVKIYRKFENELKKFDVVIIDTAGRDALSGELIKELDHLNKAVNAEEKLLVISADMGQAAEKQAKAFHESCGITGVIITKLEGTAKGGGALVACSVTGSPVKFVGTGEKVDDFEHFNPKGFVGRLLGMGDLEALLEKAKEAIKEEDAEDLGKRFLKGEFNLIDLYEQMSAMKKMGSLKKLVEMIPGFSSLQLPKEMLDVQEEKLEKWKIAMQSMSKGELEDPEIITAERIDRISKGSGISTNTIRELIKQYRQSKKLVKMFKGSKGDMSKMMKKFQGKFPAGFKM